MTIHTSTCRATDTMWSSAQTPIASPKTARIVRTRKRMTRSATAGSISDGRTFHYAAAESVSLRSTAIEHELTASRRTDRSGAGRNGARRIHPGARGGDGRARAADRTLRRGDAQHRARPRAGSGGGGARARGRRSSSRRATSNRRPARSSSTLTDSGEPGDTSYEHGRDRDRALRRRRAEDGRELQEARRGRLLRRRHLPPRHPRLHGPGRRPDGNRLAAAPATRSRTSSTTTRSSAARSRWRTPGRTRTARSSSSSPLTRPLARREAHGLRPRDRRNGRGGRDLRASTATRGTSRTTDVKIERVELS